MCCILPRPEEQSQTQGPASKAAVLRINLNVEGCGIVAAPVHVPSLAPLLLPSFFHTISFGPHAASGWRIHCGVEVTELSTNKQHSLSPPRSLVRDGQTGPHRPRLVVSRKPCPPLSPSPHASSFIIGTAVINTHMKTFLYHA